MTSADATTLLQNALIWTVADTGDLQPMAAQIGGYRVERRTQGVTVGTQTRCPFAPVSGLPRSVQRLASEP